MLKLTLKKIKNNENGYDINLKTEDSSTIEFMAGIISIIKGYQNYVLEQEGVLIPDKAILKEVKALMKKSTKIEDMGVDYE